ncbi:MAG: ROK family protein [Acidobacteria bacterium]|nr:ROK family protein [Acidobacteriota bacterium]
MKRFSVGADLGGTNLRIAAVDESGKIFEKISLATRAQQGRDTVVRELCRAIRELTQKQEGAGSFAGIGVGIPGIIYLKTGTVRQSPNLPGWENYPVQDEIESLLGVRVFLENDANVAALGEKWIGLGRDVNSLCMLTLGTGVGGGVVLNGKIWHGFLGMAGELGHIVVAENGVACSCGGHGCLETEASATAIVRKGEEAVAAGRSPALAEARSKAAKLTARMIYETAKAGDAASKAIFESVGRYLGIGIAGLTNALNLPLYVIGGGAAASWDLFAPAMMEEARKRSFIFREGSTRIERAVLKGDAGLCGAAYLPLQVSAEQ